VNDQCDKLAVDRKEEEEMEMRKEGEKETNKNGKGVEGMGRKVKGVQEQI